MKVYLNMNFSITSTGIINIFLCILMISKFSMSLKLKDYIIQLKNLRFDDGFEVITFHLINS